jgi:hypothetical protein
MTQDATQLALAVRRCTERWQDTASVPIKIRPHVCAALAADPADKPRFAIRTAEDHPASSRR